MTEKKIDALFSALGCSNSDIARCIGCSPSNISRLHTGARQYLPSSRPVAKFVEGIYIFAEKNNMLNILCEICAREDNSRSALIPALTNWLYSDEKIPENILSPAPRIRRRHNAKFGEKLNDIMNLLELSNIRLARRLNIDPSAVSRFRSGVRSPHAPLSKALARELILTAAKSGKIGELEKMSGFSHGTLSEDNSDTEAFSLWLYDADGASDTVGIDNLLDNIDSLPSVITPLQSDVISPALFDTDELSKKDVYWGTDGLREAVVRFLAQAACTGAQLCLYSDQDMNWMVGDKEYHAKWNALMIACIKNNVKIKIVHNIERGMDEMLSAIQSWLPLYMSGAIESYVCRRTPDARFTHTLFLNRGAECIFAAHVRGTEDNGRYEYLTDERSLASFENEYANLLHKSAPLIKIYFYNHTDRTKADGGNLSVMFSSLSLATMPRALLCSILGKNNVSQKSEILEFYDAHRAEFEKSLARGSVNEFISLPSKEELLSGRVRVNISQPLCDKEIFYSADEYAEHITAVLDLIDKNKSYNFYILPEPLFSNIQIISTGKSIAVIRSENPYTEFVFSEPMMMRGFKSYFDLLKSKFRTHKNDVINHLEQFLR